LLFCALGLAMVLEGLPYFVAPRLVRAYMRLLSQMKDGRLRGVGFSLIVLGLLVAYVATR
jgi:uncharacterized protein YjeT (DUF2065 family)